MKVVINSAQNLVILCKNFDTNEYETLLEEITIYDVENVKELRDILLGFQNYDVEVWNIKEVKEHLKAWLS